MRFPDESSRIGTSKTGSVLTVRTRSQTLKMGSIKDVPKKRKRDEIDDKEVKPQAKRALKDEKSSSVEIAQRINSMQTKRRVTRIPKIPKNALAPTLHKNELVWAYIKGYPFWPGVIEEFLPNGKYLIHFFGDYSRGQVTRRFITNYFEGFNQFSSNFGNIKLKKAVDEAMFLIFEKHSTDECFVCKMLECKRRWHQENNI